jgi:hypothetical protein
MTLVVEVQKRGGDWGDLQGWSATVRDDEYPGLLIGFEYEFHRYESLLLRSGFAVRWDPDDPPSSEISLYEIRRDFPIAVWERAAQSHVVSEIEREVEEDGSEPPPIEAPSSSERGTSRLMLVAAEYVKNINEGVPDPVAAIARSHGVKPETARSWVHRARTKGYLGPAEAGKAGVTAPTGTSTKK